MSGQANFNFDGKVVFVSGGGTGIGEGIADAFAEAGAVAVVGGRRLEPLERFRARHGKRGDFIQMDVSRDEDRHATIETIISRHGRLDVLVNNAMAYTSSTFEAAPPDALKAMIDVLLVGSMSMSQLALPHLARTSGCIINISSVVGRFVPYPPQGMVIYSAAKAGINQFTRALATEIGPSGVRINTIAPGPTISEAMVVPEDPEAAAAFHAFFGVGATPLQRYGEPSDIAGVALFLASSAAGWVTGQVIDASGGWGLTG